MRRGKPERARKARRLLLAALVPLAFGACGDTPDPVAPDPEPTNIEVLSGDEQRAVQGLSLPEPVVVRVLDQDGQPFSGATVAFAPSPGHGGTDPASIASDADGRATATWTLGSDSGEQTLTVSVADVTAQVRATAIDLEAELDTLFTPPSQAEVDAIRADWASRDFSAADVRVELSEDYALGDSPTNLRIVSHTVAGVRHYGAIVVPTGAEPGGLPLVAYLHGGDGGVAVDDLQFVALALGELHDRFVYVIPSYRSEPLEYGDTAWVSEGPSSHWDYDVDDVLALVNVAFESTPEAMPGGYSLIGGSRGAGAALLTGIRDERVERIVAFFGPTDFFDEWVREIVTEAALRMPRELPGVEHLDSTVVQPYIRGELTRPEARLELVRRSSVLFAADLPSVQLHHGTIDMTVSVSQAESLMAAMEALGRGPPDFEAYIYEGGGHDLLSISEGILHAAAYLTRWLEEITGSRQLVAKSTVAPTC